MRRRTFIGSVLGAIGAVLGLKRNARPASDTVEKSTAYVLRPTEDPSLWEAQVSPPEIEPVGVPRMERVIDTLWATRHT